MKTTLFEDYLIDESTVSNDHYDRIEESAFREIAKARKVKIRAHERRAQKIAVKFAVSSR